MKITVEKGRLSLAEGQAVAFDFDGVIHKYRRGWNDKKIYDEVNQEAIELMLRLKTFNVPVVIISAREPQQIKEWWDKQCFSLEAKVLDEKSLFHNTCDYVGITNRKIPAQLYIDDRAYKYEGQTAKQVIMDFTVFQNEVRRKNEQRKN